MHDGSPGYTMAELLTALGAAMMCSVLLALLSFAVFLLNLLIVHNMVYMHDLISM